MYYNSNSNDNMGYSGTSLYCGHHWDRLIKCPDEKGARDTLIKLTFGIVESVLIIEVSMFQNVLIKEVPLYTGSKLIAANHFRQRNNIFV